MDPFMNGSQLVAAIITVRPAKDKLVKQLRSVLHTCDEDCSNVHFQMVFVHEEQDNDDPISPKTFKVPLCFVPLIVTVIAKSGYFEQHLLIILSHH